MFENKMLTEIFGPRMDGIRGEFRLLHNEDLRELYTSLSIVRIAKYRGFHWAGHVA